jgi:hypothetical protein
MAFPFEDLTFPGSYEDHLGRESIVWHVRRTDWVGPLDLGDWSFEVEAYWFHTVIRGIPIRGVQLDSLEPTDWDAARAAGLTLSRYGEIGACTLAGELPSRLNDLEDIVPCVLSFRLDLQEPGLRSGDNVPRLRLGMEIRGTRFEVVDNWFDDGMSKLEEVLPTGTSLVCCFTCLYSDYPPGRQGLMGMLCFRDAKKRYLKALGKAIQHVPITEIVMETYMCLEYRCRIPGTGYRG